MAKKTGIPWADHTFNPWWGCVKVSPGCANCYAETFSKRTGHDIWGPAKTTERRTFGPSHWAEPLAWQKDAEKDPYGGVARDVRGHLAFCASMGDVFEDHPTVNAQRPRLWPLFRSTPDLHWQILTKRPENICAMLPDDWGTGYPNVWLGTSVEDQQRADERIPVLLSVPAAVRFLSCEPLIGPIDMWWLFVQERAPNKIHWIIVGGESGNHRRPMDLAWMEAIVHACEETNVPVFVKQDNAFKPDQRGRIPDRLWHRHFPVRGAGVL